MNKLVVWLKQHRLDVILLLLVLTIGGVVSGMNMTGYPQRFEDEGTYVSQAWAVREHGTLTHYTYWYDHPPVGWLQTAAYLTVTDGWNRYSSAVTAGREFALVMHLATIGLLYALARRLGLRAVFAAVGTLLFALSPLSVEFGRYLLLDNIALPWLLGALLLALSPRKHLLTAIGAAVCMAIAVLTKETLLALLPVVLYCLWKSGDVRNRRYTMAVFLVIFASVSALYVLYAALKNELFPGPGHVSLLGSLYWQIFGRVGSGSIFNQNSDSYGLVTYWLNIDYYLIAMGIIGLGVALWQRNMRPAGLALLISIVMVMRGGYLPYPYVIVILPFAAICAAAALDQLVRFGQSRHWMPLRIGSWFVLAEAVAILAIVVAPAWQAKLYVDTTMDADAPSRQAVNWVTKNVSRNDRMVVESALWSDLENKGFNLPKPVWLYKTETDPAVKAEIGGWRGIDYVILNGPTIGSTNFDTSFQTVSTAVKHSTLQAEFGEGNNKVMVYKVNN